jgi:hypothetical protein
MRLSTGEDLGERIACTARHERDDRVHDDEIDRAGAHTRVGDFWRLFTTAPTPGIGENNARRWKRGGSRSCHRE